MAMGTVMAITAMSALDHHIAPIRIIFFKNRTHSHSNMTLQQLEYVVAVAQHRHFLKAAEACDVTQPTLSSMIQKLEDELGVKIFDRKQKPIAPTAIGNLIIEQAQHMIAQAQRLKASVDEEQQTVCGTFRLAVLPTIAPYLIPRFLPVFSEKHPQIDLRISEMKTAEIKQALDKGEMDAAIVAHLTDMDDYDSIPLFYEQFFVYAAPNAPLHDHSSIRTTDLRDIPLWLLDEGHCFRDQLVSFCHLKSAIRSQRSYHLGSIETFMRIVENGMGVTFIPELCTLQLSPEQKKLVRPFAIPIPSRQIVMLTSNDFVRRKLLRLITEKIKESVPPEMLRLNKNLKSI